jgi:hypothetical protein
MSAMCVAIGEGVWSNNTLGSISPTFRMGVDLGGRLVVVRYEKLKKASRQIRYDPEPIRTPELRGPALLRDEGKMRDLCGDTT